MKDFSGSISLNKPVGVNESNDRNLSVDKAKGLAIILMVACHVGMPRSMRGFSDYVYEFHMPLFFFMAGWCFKFKYLDDFKRFGRQKIKGIWWPFFKWNVVFLLLHNIFVDYQLIDQGYYYGSDFGKRLIEVGLFTNSERLLGGFWFLEALFFTSIIGWIVLKLCRGVNGRLLIAMLLMLGVIIVGHMFLPPRLLKSVTFCPTFKLLYTLYFLSGVIFSKLDFKYLQYWSVVGRILLFLGLFVASICLVGPSSVHATRTWDMPVYLVGGLSGILLCYSVCVLLSSTALRTVLSYCGRKTMSILVWHFLSFKIVSFVIIIVWGADYALLSCPSTQLPEMTFVKWLSYTFVGVSAPLLIDYVLMRLKRLTKRACGNISVGWRKVMAR